MNIYKILNMSNDINEDILDLFSEIENYSSQLDEVSIHGLLFISIFHVLNLLSIIKSYPNISKHYILD